MQKYTKICSGPRSMSPVHYMHLLVYMQKIWEICKICKHESHMQNMQKYARPTSSLLDALLHSLAGLLTTVTTSSASPPASPSPFEPRQLAGFPDLQVQVSQCVTRHWQPGRIIQRAWSLCLCPRPGRASKGQRGRFLVRLLGPRYHRMHPRCSPSSGY